MKSESIIKSLEKNGLKIVKEVQKNKDHFDGSEWETISYECVNGKTKCHWYHSEDVRMVQVMSVNEKNDSRSDYFPGQFVDKLKTLITLMVG